ncbi:MAG: ABC transporter ATP-binding protein [Desulfobacterales bacterium]|nr:ABC transporter ATP-binding protein [Desulfobacterales bacterium]
MKTGSKRNGPAFSFRRRPSGGGRGFHLGKALRLVWKSAPGWTAAGAALVMIQGLLPLASLYLMKRVLDAVEAGLTSPDKGALFRGEVVWLILLTGGATLLGGLLSALAQPVREAQGQAFSDYMYGVLHKKSVEADLAYYESAEYYDTLHRAQREGPFRPLNIVNGLVQAAQNAISLAAMAGLLLTLHWAVALALLATALPGAAVRLKFINKLFRWQRKRTRTERLANYFNHMLTGVRHAKEIRLFGLGEAFIRRFHDLRRDIRREKVRLAAQRAMAGFGVQTVTTLAVLGSYAFFVHQTMAGAITMGSLVMYYQALRRGQGFLGSMMGALSSLYENNLFLSNLFEFLELKPRVASPRRPEPVPRPMKRGVSLENVRFRYPDNKRTVLENISLTIRPGEHIALVGENGSGKTTLLKLLCRLYDPDEGRVRMDGVDLRRFDLPALRREISVIFQDYVQYHLTARENIRPGGDDPPPDHRRIVSAARLSGADDFIRDLPRGYENILGKRFKGGAELSVGQWQKVALARAFLRDAQIIALDEPTSSLDARAEFEVFRRFRKLAEGKTAILISHRFSTVKNADRVYVLEKGRIVESGSHEELVRLGGRYASLYEIQARNYR